MSMASAAAAATAAISPSSTISVAMNEDVLRLIYLNLPLKDLLKKCSVSKMTARFCESEKFWKEYVEKNYFFGQVENIFIEKSREPDSLISDPGTVIEKLNEMERDKLIDLKPFPNSVADQKSFKKIAFDIQKIIDHCSENDLIMPVKTLLALIQLVDVEEAMDLFKGDLTKYNFVILSHNAGGTIEEYYLLYDRIIFRDDDINPLFFKFRDIYPSGRILLKDDYFYNSLEKVLNYITTPTLYWFKGNLIEINYNAEKVSSYINRVGYHFDNDVKLIYKAYSKILYSYEDVEITKLLKLV